MINIPMKSKNAVDQSSVTLINSSYTQEVISTQNITAINIRQSETYLSMTTSQPQYKQIPVPQTPIPIPSPVQKTLPILYKPVQKGQRVPIHASNTISSVTACFGWNTTNNQCDVDVSAFLLGENGKVIGDSWFVFYGQTASPDNSVQLFTTASEDCETVKINFQMLNPNVKKIVFVLTINEAFEKNLNFGMLKDAYVRILNETDHSELVSFKMTDYYSNVISMMIGELYQHSGTWKFNAIGNGVARDLAGLCELYGVQVV